MMTFHAPSGQVVKGIAQEIVDRLMAHGMSPGHIYDTTGYVPTVTPFDTEALKFVELEMLLEAGVDLLLHSFVVGSDTGGYQSQPAAKSPESAGSIQVDLAGSAL